MAASTKPASQAVSAQAAKRIEEFASWPLFQHVGEKVDDKQVKMVASWEEAMQTRGKSTFVNLGTSISNRLHHYLDAQKGAAWAQQNFDRIYDAVRAVLERKFKNAIDAVRKKNKLPIQFEYGVIGDLLMDCLLADFPEPASVPWNERMIGFYRLGHFPAGWSGRLPAQTKTDYNPLPDVSTGKWLVY